ncbi:hypothetical protein L226DRAFT_611527 [Lentinus tigrinus ALCF2SS1-7]|uniref:uncharacterized protein n=1 Tax=Lentinus tigrinus ALCF2SS1-7 TaxID=1328758 RepID=UPI0011662BE4|nr:hypothetical protein L226DRAFT_611527 [Lentinus tigrinus ALCF2SS1-7]
MVVLPRDDAEALRSLLGDPSSFLSKTNGAMLVGSFIATVLYGSLLHQAYRYTRLYPADGAFMKILVPTIVILETFRTVCDIHYSYHDLVTKYAQILDIVLYLPWSANLLPICAVLIGITTHLFFILRIWKLKSRLRFLAVLGTAFHVVELALGIVLSVRGFQLGAHAYFSKKWIIAVCFGAGTLADLSITGALLAVMYNGRVSHERQPSIWDAVTVYFINTGLLVFLLDFVVFILVLSTNNNLYWSAVHAVTTKIYATTLMSVLNSRTLRVGSNDGFMIHSGAAVRSIAHARRLATVQRWNVPEEPDPTPARIAINVQTELGGDDIISKVESGIIDVSDKRDKHDKHYV